MCQGVKRGGPNVWGSNVQGIKRVTAGIFGMEGCGIIKATHGCDAKSLMTGYPLSFLRESIHSNKNTIKMPYGKSSFTCIDGLVSSV